MSRELLDRFALNNDWIEEEGGPITDRAGLGEDLARDSDVAHAFRYLQTLVAGEGQPLPYAPPNVRIVVSRDGWKEHYALVYGFPPADSGEAGYSSLATRFPEQAEMFRVYYGHNYGPGAGYDRVETVQPLDPEVVAKLKAGVFTDDEAEQLLNEANRLMEIYWELNIAAREKELNPEFAERVTETFYRNSGC